MRLCWQVRVRVRVRVHVNLLALYLGRSQTDLTPASQLARTQTLNPKPSCAQTLRAQTLKPNRYTGGSSGAGHRRLNLCGRVLVDSDTRKQVKMRCCTPATPILSLTSPSTS